MDIDKELKSELDGLKTKLSVISEELEDIAEIKENLKSSSESLKVTSDQNKKLIDEASKLHSELTSATESLKKSHELFSDLSSNKISDLLDKLKFVKTIVIATVIFSSATFLYLVYIMNFT